METIPTGRYSVNGFILVVSRLVRNVPILVLIACMLKPVLPRNCRSARRMEGRISGLRHRRRGGPARVAADRFEGPECGKKGAQAGRGTAVRSLAEDMAVSVNTSANTCSLENVWCRRTLFEPKPPLPSGLRGEKWLMGETGGQSMG